jgi:hypothetical protein
MRNYFCSYYVCCNPTSKECEDDTRTPEMGTWEFFGTLENSKLDCRGQNTSLWGVLYTIEKSWSLDVENGFAWAIRTSAAQVTCERRVESQNWQFDSRPLKVSNWPDSFAFRRRATYHWKGLDKDYNFSSDLIAIGGLHKNLCALKVAGVPSIAISGVPLGRSRDKKPFGCGPCGVAQSILYGGRWWLPLSLGRGESWESKVARGSS